MGSIRAKKSRRKRNTSFNRRLCDRKNKKLAKQKGHVSQVGKFQKPLNSLDELLSFLRIDKSGENGSKIHAIDDLNQNGTQVEMIQFKSDKKRKFSRPEAFFILHMISKHGENNFKAMAKDTPCNKYLWTEGKFKRKIRLLKSSTNYEILLNEFNSSK